ncbi:unnamed protein product [Caenorhabditis auriculariae]|uniref:Uncharacterized protein n=1 Tax=Caenorhabditis auriculariae TaxID=2777116 RepID=A0A8S1HEP4_9PELO|nr:unnamed protein product [Caenorhabditis auriculariae]
MLRSLALVALLAGTGTAAQSRSRLDSGLVQKWSHSDCVRPWQRPMMKKATLAQPARAHECHPDARACPEGINSVCQFSLKSFKYICCEDKKDAEIPSCPKFHETLLVSCGSSVEGSCPRGYKCLPSVADVNVKLCCKPNYSISYKEPEASFVENRIVPKVLPVAPRYELSANFSGEHITMGQLFDVNHLDFLESPPVMSGVELNDDYLYTLILVDSTAKSVNWFIANIPSIDGALEVHRRTKSAVSYVMPDATDEPAGIHVMVLCLFEQKEAFHQREVARIADTDFEFGQWLEENSHILERAPLAATFYGYSTKLDSRP